MRAGRAALVWLALALPAANALGVDPAHGADPARLDALKADMARGEAELAELARRSEALRDDARDAGQRLVAAAAAVQQREAELASIDARLADLAADEKQRLSALRAGGEKLAELVAALGRISRVPPGALVLKPGLPVDNLRAAILLRAAVPGLERQAAALRAELTRLGQLRVEMERRRAALDRAARALKDDRDQLAELVKDRESGWRETSAATEAERARLSSLANEVRDLSSLIARLEQDAPIPARKPALPLVTIRPSAPPAPVAAAPAPRAPQASQAARPLLAALPSPRADGLRLPVVGKLVVKFGGTDAMGAHSQGLSIRSGAGATVVTPLAGTVKFAGPFRNHGQILILEHEGAYHSVLAGLAHIDAEVGRALAAGEPVGRMGDGAEGLAPELYFELRREGQPVDPARLLRSKEEKG